MIYAFNDTDKSKVDLLDYIYPIGSIYMSVNSVNPENYFGGEWVSWGSGKVPIGVDTAQTEFNTVEKEGGSKSVTLKISEIPSHQHTTMDVSLSASNRQYVKSITSVGTAASGTQKAVLSSYDPAYFNTSHVTGLTGGGNAHTNLQPYITCYMWKRIA